MFDPGCLSGSKEVKDGTELGEGLLRAAVFELRATDAGKSSTSTLSTGKMLEKE